MIALELDEVVKTYPGSPPVTALRPTTLAVRAGEMVAVVGPSGSGKSTLLAVAGTLDRPTSGQVRVGGSNLSGLKDRDLAGMRAHLIGFVFQQFRLFPTLSALDNVASGLLYRGTPRRSRLRAAAAALDRVGMAPRANHRPAQLSGGECQRVAIARALIGQPSVILADEPTGSLDSVQGLEVLGLLQKLHRDGSTLVIVTHNPEVAARAPRVVRMRDGAVLADTGAT